MEGNITCDTHECSLPAEFFAFQGKNKIRACTNHYSDLMSKRLTPIDIEGFNLVSIPRDVGEFMERVYQRDCGRGNLAMLAATCEQELREATEQLEHAEAKTLMLVKAAYKEGLRRVRERWEQVKDELNGMLSHINDFPKQRDVQLTPTELLLLQESVSVPKFLRVTVSDIAYRVSETILLGFKYSTQSADTLLQCSDINERPRIIKEIVAESEKNAKEGNFEVAVNDIKYALTLGFEDSARQTKLERQLIVATLAEEQEELLELWRSLEESEIQRVISAHATEAERAPQSRDKWLNVLALLNLCYPQGGQRADVSFKLDSARSVDLNALRRLCETGQSPSISQKSS